MAIFICSGNKGKIEEFKHAFASESEVYGLNDLGVQNGIQNKFIEPIENSNYFICNASIKLFSALKFLIENNTPRNINMVVVDDSGLCVPELNFLPGVHSAHFAGIPKNDNNNNLLLQKKINENTTSNSRKNVQESAQEKRLKAFFVCFLLSVRIHNHNEFEFIKEINFSEATCLIEKNIAQIEKKLLNKVDLNSTGGAFHEKIEASLICKEFSTDVFIDINYGFCCGEVSTKAQNNIPNAGHGYDPIFYPLSDPGRSFASIPLSEKNKISHRARAMQLLGGL
ncbi:MAG: non-canonical purine NTP pyrophosphatase [Bdellovibrionota bacterium]